MSDTQTATSPLLAGTNRSGHWWVEYRDENGGGCFADCGDSTHAEKRCKEIVRAVNSHDKLLEALKAIRDKALLVEPFANQILRGDLEEIVKLAENAIQSAEEEEPNDRNQSK